MKCIQCSKQLKQKNTHDHYILHQPKRKQIYGLRKQLHEQREKYNFLLGEKFSSKHQKVFNLITNEKQDEQTQSLLIQELQKIIEKQNKLARIRILKKNIKNIKAQLQRRRKQRNQKLRETLQAENSLQKVRRQLSANCQQRLKGAKQIFSRKNQNLLSLNRFIQNHFSQISKDFSSIQSIHRTFRLWESEQVFEIRKVDELDFLNFENMNHSFYEVENIEEIILKNKTSEKGIHAMFQNILILQILKNICPFWIPYNIDWKIDLIQSKLIGKSQYVRVCGQTLIDFSQTTKLSNNIIQILNQESQRQSITHVKSNLNTTFLSTYMKAQLNDEIQEKFDELIEYNKRKYALNKQYFNYMQVNLEFLSMKMGIQKRPLVFFESDLMQAIIKQFLWTCSFAQQGQFKQNEGYVMLSVEYKSMLKQLKMAKMLDSLQKLGVVKQSKQQIESSQIIPQVQESQECQKKVTQTGKNTKASTIFSSYIDSLTKYFTKQQTIQQQIVPKNLQNIVSNSNENDEFQLLDDEQIDPI